MNESPVAEDALLAAEVPPARVALWVQLLWACAAFVSSLCGIGGGLFAVPLLHYLGGLPLKRAMATSLCLVLALSATSTAVEIFHAGSGLRAEIVAALVVGGWLGARAGLAIAPRVDVRVLKLVFAAVLVLAAARILVLDAVPDARTSDELALTLQSAAAVLAIGFAGGFVAPLLGIGGGVFVIPALFLLLPELTYLEARACSMAMTVFVSAQSVQSYWRRREIEVAQVGGLIVATVVGALAGVLVVHLDGWIETARTTMGLLLVALALRFVGDLLSGARAQAR